MFPGPRAEALGGSSPSVSDGHSSTVWVSAAWSTSPLLAECQSG